MPDRRFDVVVIGAGIIGASIAWHLARDGRGSIAVLEKEAGAGAGSTAKAAGGIRAQFSSAVNIELSKLSMERFERFPEEMGVPADFIQAGYLFLASTDSHQRLFEANAALQRRLGLEIEMLDRAGVERRAPYVRSDDLRGGVFHGRDGYASPADYLAGYEKRARERGVSFLFGEEVTGREGRELRTSSGAVAAEHVVIAAGAWSGELGRRLGFEIPVQPVRRQCFVTEPAEGFAHPIPMTVDFATGVYLHSESGGLLVGKADREERAGFTEGVDWGFVERVSELAVDRVPALGNARVKTAWAGYYEVTPDHHPLLGSAGEDGWWLACGFSGHGVMHAPATGAILAALIAGTRPPLDVSCLGPGRFAEGKAIVETNVI
jgi:sarcosine oxidase subunit beta